MPALCEASFRSLDAGGKFRQFNAVTDGFAHMRFGRVVMACDRDAALGAAGRQIIAVLGGIFGRCGLSAAHEFGKSLVAQSALLLIIEDILVHRLELALARGVIHQRNQPHARIGFEVFEMLKHIGGSDLTAQMQQVVRTQAVLIRCRLDGVSHFAHFALFETAILVRAEPQAIEHGGDAGRRNLCIMGLNGGDLVPDHARTW